ncbi:hypothetical protein FY046_01745 [Erwinia sp. 1181_3]|uniref:hypothetical protein n=1 Tax=Erwinia sp. 1181_3 TaxID=2605957 RepID=UPI00405A2BC7
MDIYKHFKNGTLHITPDGDHHGYEPKRTESFQAITIKHQDYTIDLDPHGISIRYKYIHIRHGKYFTVGRWRYPLSAMGSSPEHKHLANMHGLLEELIHHHSIDSVPINDWKLSTVLTQYNE